MSNFFFPQIKDMLDDEAKKIAYSCALYVLQDEFNATEGAYKAKKTTYCKKVKSHIIESNDDVFPTCRKLNDLPIHHEIPSDSILV